MMRAILGAIKRDRTGYAMTYKAMVEGAATGAVSSWSTDMPDASLTSDNELAAAVASMVTQGLTYPQCYGEWLRIQCSADLGWQWSEGDRHCCQLALVAQAGPAIKADGVEVLAAAALLLVVLVADVVLPAVWSVKPARRKAALAVLDRLVRWKGH